jgi:hypothetical protein
MLMQKVPNGAQCGYGEPEDTTTSHIVTECSKCSLKQKLWMQGYFDTEVQLQAQLIGFNATECCGAPMITTVHLQEEQA